MYDYSLPFYVGMPTQLGKVNIDDRKSAARHHRFSHSHLAA